MKREIVFANTAQNHSYENAAKDAMRWILEADCVNDWYGDFIAQNNGAIYRAFELYKKQKGRESEGYRVEKFVISALNHHVNILFTTGTIPHPNGPRVVAFYLRDKELDPIERWLSRTIATVSDFEASVFRIYTSAAACPEAWFKYYNPQVIGKKPDLTPYYDLVDSDFMPSIELRDALERAAHENGMEPDLGLHNEVLHNLNDVLKTCRQEIKRLSEPELAQCCYNSGLTFGDAGWLIDHR